MVLGSRLAERWGGVGNASAWFQYGLARLAQDGTLYGQVLQRAGLHLSIQSRGCTPLETPRKYVYYVQRCPHSDLI